MILSFVISYYTIRVPAQAAKPGFTSTYPEALLLCYYSILVCLFIIMFLYISIISIICVSLLYIFKHSTILLLLSPFTSTYPEAPSSSPQKCCGDLRRFAETSIVPPKLVPNKVLQGIAEICEDDESTQEQRRQLSRVRTLRFPRAVLVWVRRLRNLRNIPKYIVWWPFLVGTIEVSANLRDSPQSFCNKLHRQM